MLTQGKGISRAYQVLKDPLERAKYDRQKRSKYREPGVDERNLYNEEFHDNAYGDDSGSDPEDDGDEDSTNATRRPNSWHLKIYESATPFIHGILNHPPTTPEEKRARAEEAAAFNQRIKEQNQKDGLKGDDLTLFYIEYPIFESNSILLAPQVEKLRKNKDDQNAQKWVTFYNNALEDVAKTHGYPISWTPRGMAEAKNRQWESGNGGSKRGQREETGAAGAGAAGARSQNAGPDGNAAQSRAASGDSKPIAKWKPGYTLHGEKIIAYIPKEKTVQRMVNGLPGPREKVVTGYQFIIKDEDEETIALVPGADIGEKAKSGYFKLPEDQRHDARYSEERYGPDDAELFDELVDFASNPFKTKSSDRLAFPPGYGLVRMVNGTEDILSRTALRNMLGKTDADWEIQECDKRHNRIPAWKISPIKWREKNSLEIEAPTKKYFQMRSQRRLDQGSSEDSDMESEGLFVPDKPARRGVTRGRGRANGLRGGQRESSLSRTRQTAEMAEMRGEIAGLKELIQQLAIKLA